MENILNNNDDRLIDIDDVCINALETFGKTSQMMMVIEEMSELQKEISKNFRGEANIEKIAEEIADVEIMLNQMKWLFEVHLKVKNYKDLKLKRLCCRIDEQKTNDELRGLVGKEVNIDETQCEDDDLYHWLRKNKRPLIVNEISIEDKCIWVSNCPYRIGLDNVIKIVENKKFKGRTLYAYGKGRELFVNSINFDTETFSGYYKDLNGNTFWKLSEDINDYEFYDDNTQMGECFTIEELKTL